MSIMVNLYYTGMNGDATKFVREMERSGTANLIREEAGNERYEYFYCANDPETVLLIDMWKDQNSIDIHHASAMMDKVIELRDKYNLHMRVERFSMDESGIPSEDRKFIKQ